MIPYDRVYVFGWIHPTGSVAGVADSIVKGMTQNGVYAKSVIMGTEESLQTLREIITYGGKTLLIGVTHTSLFFKISDKYIWDYTNCDTAVYFIDNPAIFGLNGLAITLNSPENTAFLFADNSHRRQFRAFLRSLGRKNPCLFFPYGGNYTPRPTIHPNGRDHNKKQPLIVFANLGHEAAEIFHQVEKSLYKLPILSESRLDKELVAYMINELPQRDFGFDIFEAFEPYKRDDHLYKDFDLLQVFLALDSYLKRYRRVLTIDALRELPIRVYGEGWELIDNKPRNWEFAGKVSYDEQYNIFRASDFILNVDPVWPEGIHDRVFNAMACGAIAITNRNKMTDFYLNDNVDCIIYNNVESLEKKIAESIDRVENLRSETTRSFRLKHSWRSRCQNLLSELT